MSSKPTSKPAKKRKRKPTIVQSFAEFREGNLPIIEPNEHGRPVYIIVNVYTKPGAKRYEAAHNRPIQAEQKERIFRGKKNPSAKKGGTR